MSTRSSILIKNGKTEILLYRHCDGYLTGTGQDLHDDLLNSKFEFSEKNMNYGFGGKAKKSDLENGNFNIADFTKKLLDQDGSYRIDNEPPYDIEYLYTFKFEDNYNHGGHYNRVKLKSIEVNQDVGFGRGGKRKFKTLSEFLDAINKARKENE